MFNLSSFFFTMSISDSLANNLIASVSQHLFFFFVVVRGIFFFPKVTFVEEGIS